MWVADSIFINHHTLQCILRFIQPFCTSCCCTYHNANQNSCCAQSRPHSPCFQDLLYIAFLLAVARRICKISGVPLQQSYLGQRIFYPLPFSTLLWCNSKKRSDNKLRGCSHVRLRNLGKKQALLALDDTVPVKQNSVSSLRAKDKHSNQTVHWLLFHLWLLQSQLIK